MCQKKKARMVQGLFVSSPLPYPSNITENTEISTSFKPSIDDSPV